MFQNKNENKLDEVEKLLSRYQSDHNNPDFDKMIVYIKIMFVKLYLRSLIKPQIGMISCINVLFNLNKDYPEKYDIAVKEMLNENKKKNGFRKLLNEYKDYFK